MLITKGAICVAALLSLAGVGAQAQTVLMDFETQEDFKAWHYEGRGPETPVRELSRAEEYATSGRFSLCFQTPQWKPGMPEWPAFEGVPALTDWSGFERFSFEVTNPTDAPQRLFLFISDTAHATREGYHEMFYLGPRTYNRVMINLAQVAARGINTAQIRVLHFYTQRPDADMRIYIDRLCLLKAEEPEPAVSEDYLKHFAVMLAPLIESARRTLQDAEKRLSEASAQTPEIERWAKDTVEEIRNELAGAESLVRRGDPVILKGLPEIDLLGKRLDGIFIASRFRTGFAGIRRHVSLEDARKDVAVGFASSMEKILPRPMTAQPRVAAGYEISLAQNEKESFQVIILPYEGDLKNVRARVSDLKSDGGAVFQSKNIKAVAVGYVKTEIVPPYGSEVLGWWPDPILEFQDVCDIAKGDAQAFWIRLRAPANQPAGVYKGKIEIEADGRKMFSFDLSARVFGFRLPDATPLPLAVTFWPMYYEPHEKGGYREGEYRDATWKKWRFEWAEFLADYYLSYDSLYAFSTWAPDFEILQRLKKEGRLGRFNLGYFSACPEAEEDKAAWRRRTIDVIRPRYEKAKDLGLLEHAYIYGCDENPESLFPAVQRAAEILKKEFPGVPILTTTYDHSFGTKSVIRSVDGFCPLTPRYDPAVAAQARAEGREVWWYICCSPHHPYANMFIEYPAIEGRLLMGAMTAKYRPDGFLYYQISIWNSREISTGPFTNWNPRSWTTYNGDGSWTCLGPEGMPIPTIRLENFRDGLEDYAYYRILEATADAVEKAGGLTPQQARWLDEAKSLLNVPEDLVKDMANYSRDPAKLYEYRNRIAQMIEAAGIEPANPWTKK